MKILLVLLSLTTATSAQAYSELTETYRGARAQAMGNAFTAIADDEQAIFMNPAGLVGIKKYQMQYVAFDVEMSSDSVSQATGGGTSGLGDMSSDLINSFMGKDIYTRAQVSPSFVMPNFGIAILADGQAALYAKNLAFPNVTLGYQNTNVVQVAYGFSLMRNSRRERNDFRMGFAGKLAWRRGGYRPIPLMRLTSASPTLIGEVAGTWGTGYGVDMGLQYINAPSSKLTIQWGLAWTDIGDTFFGNEADPIRNNLSSGIAGIFDSGKAKFTLSYDYRHILNATDWRKRNHFGAEVALPVLSFYGGLNQQYLTYGVGFDAWLFKITALSYAEELDTYVGQNGSRRYMLKTALKVGF